MDGTLQEMYDNFTDAAFFRLCAEDPEALARYYRTWSPFQLCQVLNWLERDDVTDDPWQEGSLAYKLNMAAGHADIGEGVPSINEVRAGLPVAQGFFQNQLSPEEVALLEASV